MSALPKPKTALTGACSVVYNNTLFEFTPTAFQALNLAEGAEWQTLPSGQAVTGGVCVGTTPEDSSKAALFIVGGTSSDSSYQGLQKFTYSTGKWETITPQTAVTENRVDHNAIYLSASDKILVYSGSQDGSRNLSSQTFTIDATDYTVLAFESSAPPATAPLLLQWSASQAVMVGGDSTNNKVFLFDATAGWSDSGTTLADPITKDSSEVKGAIMDGDDGSKQLYLFDATVSPNTVSRTALAGAGGVAITNSAPVSSKSTVRSTRERRRDLTAANWPSYNSTLAPTTTRSGYTLAAGSDGQVVISGGSSSDVLCIFSASKNAWVDATALLLGSDFSAQSVSSTASTSTISSTTAASTSQTSNTSSASTSAAAVAAASSSSSSDGSGMSAPVILGVCLGVIFGVALLLIGLLFLIKRRKQKQAFIEAGHNRRASGALPDEKDSFSSELAKASGPQYRGHVQQDSEASFSSVAILMNKMQKPALQRKASNDTKRSSASSILKQFKATIGRPQPQVIPEVDYIPRDLHTDKKNNAAVTVTSVKEPRKTKEGGPRRSSGWDRYWSGGSTLNMLGFGGNGNNAASRRVTQATESSQYSDTHRMTQDSATVPPLQVDGQPGFQRFHRVNSGSPTVATYAAQLKEEMSGEIERPVSTNSSSGYSSGIPASVHDTWDPTTPKGEWGADRATSSVYTQSIYPTPLGAPKASRPPTGLSAQPQLKVAAMSSDMSWLNLGDQNLPQRYR